MPDTAVVEEPTLAEPAVEKAPPKEKEDVEDIEKRARKPPADGPCKGCGENRPLNRLMLCYKCWVTKENEKSGWRAGQPHPKTCGCALDCAFEKPDWGN